MAFKKANPVKLNLFIQLMTLLLTWTVAKKSMPYISRLFSKAFDKVPHKKPAA